MKSQEVTSFKATKCMFIHRGFDYGDSNEPEQVLEIAFNQGQVGEIVPLNLRAQVLLV